ncbi:MAG: beta-hydroxyacyl-ACP dehydratase [Spirochaetia bacterium]|nr:beta-hydroxyacyl-ACP dehydratase [Spirochaetia bacterium]
MRYLLLDRITEIRYGSYAKGIKCVTLSEDYLEQHFPLYPIYPGALTIESLAQLSGWLINLTIRHEKKPELFAALVKVDQMKFSHQVIPGDRLELHSKIESIQDKGAMVSVEAMVGENISATGSLMFGLTKLLPGQKEVLNKYETLFTRNMTIVE